MIRLRQRLMRLEARRMPPPVGAGGAGYGVKYLPTDPETLTEIVTILAQAQAVPGPEAYDEADVAAVVALVVGLHDVLGEEDYRRYGELARRRARLGAAEAAEFARLRARAGPFDLAADDTAMGDPADLLGEHLLDDFARGAVRP